MRHLASCVSIALGCLLTATIVQAQPSRNSVPVPRVVRITGAFVPANGQPIGPVETVTLAIYAEESGGAPLWQETQTITVDAAGRYTVLLGASENDGLPMDLFASGEARWLGRRFDRPGEHEQARILLASVPYALKALDADTLGGRPASAYVVAGSAPGVRGGNVTSAQESLAGPLDTLPGSVNALPKYVNTTDLGISSMFDIGGLVGVGTASPLDAMHLKFTNTTGTMTGLAVQNLGATTSSYSGMLFYDQNGAVGQFQGFNNSTHEYRINNVASSGSINFMLGGSSKLLVASSGRIGIGTASPAVPLDVVGSAVVSGSGTTSYFLGGSANLVVDSNTSWSTSIRASSGIVAGAGYLTSSDVRAKQVVGRSNSATDLGKLLGIEVTDFFYKDVVDKGHRPQKKVIAQQLENVFPQAVTQTTDIVPDIYRRAPVKDGWIELATDLKAGERVRLITESGHRAVHEVLEVGDGKFRTDFTDDVSQVFVYGREVKDFRVVDYEAIAMLNVSATQELNRIITQQDGEIQALNARLSALEQMMKEQPPRQKQH